MCNNVTGGEQLQTIPSRSTTIHNSRRQGNEINKRHKTTTFLWQRGRIRCRSTLPQLAVRSQWVEQVHAEGDGLIASHTVAPRHGACVLGVAAHILHQLGYGYGENLWKRHEHVWKKQLKLVIKDLPMRFRQESVDVTSPVATGGGFGGLSSPNQSTKQPLNWNMRHYKSPENLKNLQCQAPLRKRKAFLATVLDVTQHAANDDKGKWNCFAGNYYKMYENHRPVSISFDITVFFSKTDAGQSFLIKSSQNSDEKCT